MGTGFIYKVDGEDRSGLVLTAYHVVELPDEKGIQVYIEDVGVFPADLVWSNEELDLAALYICCSQFRPILGSPDIPNGWVIDLNRRQQDATLQYSLGRIVESRELSSDCCGDVRFVWADMETGPGASGSPLVDMDGYLVGIVLWLERSPTHRSIGIAASAVSKIREAD